MAINTRMSLRATAAPDPELSFTGALRKVLEAATPRGVAGIARALSSLGLGNHEVQRGGIAQEIPPCDAEAVAEQAIFRRTLHADRRPQFRLEYCRAVIPEINKFASRIVTEEIALRRRQPVPGRLDVMSDGSRPHLRALMPT